MIYENKSTSPGFGKIEKIGRMVVTGMPDKDMFKVYIQEFDDNEWQDLNSTSSVSNIHYGASVASGNLYLGIDEQKSPNCVVVGAPGVNISRGVNSYTHRGAVYAVGITKDNSTDEYKFYSSHGLLQPIPEPSSEYDINNNTYFGSAVAISDYGNRLIVGASAEGVSPAGESPLGEARAYHFDSDGERWVEMGDAFHIPVARDAYDGTYVKSVDIGIDTAIIGMPNLRQSDNPCSMDGMIAIFEYGGSGWRNTGSYMGKEDSMDRIGVSVSIRDHDEVVGSSNNAQKVIDMHRHSDALPAIISYLLD